MRSRQHSIPTRASMSDGNIMDTTGSARKSIHLRHNSDIRMSNLNFSHGRSFSISRGPLYQDEDDESSLDGSVSVTKELPASWRNMPRKGQLTVLALSRFVDFFQMASLQTYMVHQLKSFDSKLPDSTISHQAGVLQGAFTAAQIVTAVLWGRVADAPWCGRKTVLLVGLIGTAFSCVGVGFSNTFLQATVWRMLGGAINGTVGSARTMVAESVDKRFHSRAFLLLPVAFNVANVLGPVLSGLLVNPVDSYPKLLGPGSSLGGQYGIRWMMNYPFAPPALLCSLLLFGESLLVALFLTETLETRLAWGRGRKPGILETWRKVWNKLISTRITGYSLLDNSQSHGLLAGMEADAIDMSPLTPHMQLEKHIPPKQRQRLPFHRIWTQNVLFTLLSIAIFDFHMGAFSSLWIIFLSTDRADLSNAKHPTRSNPFHFTGGLAFQPATIGFALAVLGVVGLILQISFYPWANARFGLMRCFRYSLFLFPMAYFLAPYITLLPSSSPPPNAASGFWIWFGISLVLTLQVGARTFALPASIILLNNSSPHPSVLATIHGIGQSVSSTFRTVGPIASGYWYGVGLEKGLVGMSWWIVAAISAIGCVTSFWVRNGSGHEILLPGEEEELGDGDK